MAPLPARLYGAGGLPWIRHGIPRPTPLADPHRMIALTGLFAAAFLAATLIPAQSEALLVVLARQGDHDPRLLWAVATLGNVLGSLVNWGIGRFAGGWAMRRPSAVARLDRAQGWYARYGWWSLWGSWLPVIGDPITLAAGLMREPLWRFLTVVTLAKGGRYALLLAATMAWPSS